MRAPTNSPAARWLEDAAQQRPASPVLFGRRRVWRGAGWRGRWRRRLGGRGRHGHRGRLGRRHADRGRHRSGAAVVRARPASSSSAHTVPASNAPTVITAAVVSIDATATRGGGGDRVVHGSIVRTATPVRRRPAYRFRALTGSAWRWTPSPTHISPWADAPGPAGWLRSYRADEDHVGPGATAPAAGSGVADRRRHRDADRRRRSAHHRRRRRDDLHGSRRVGVAADPRRHAAVRRARGIAQASRRFVQARPSSRTQRRSGAQRPGQPGAARAKRSGSALLRRHAGVLDAALGRRRRQRAGAGRAGARGGGAGREPRARRRAQAGNERWPCPTTRARDSAWS